MKTIVENSTLLSKYLFADDKQITITDDHIEIGLPDDLEFIIGDLIPKILSKKLPINMKGLDRSPAPTNPNGAFLLFLKYLDLSGS